MKNLKTLGLTLAIALTINAANANDYKIAVVNVGQVVESSVQVKTLKLEQQAKLKELEAWLVTVKSDVDKQSTKENREKLIKKYDAEFVKKQNNIRSSYAKKLNSIDKTISSIISKEAKEKGYDLVLPKGTVLYGGLDITNDIIKKVK
ncbi:MAG: OmpH family outer membrane protein [Candidatus Gastranaerophilaceae bacterium]